MAEQGHNFTADGARRIVDAVRAVEAEAVPTGQRRGRAPPKIGPVLVRITGNESGGGKYTGTLWTPPASDVAATGNLTEAECGVAGVTVRVINLREVGLATHDLASASFLPLIFPGVVRRVNADGTL